jgi:hypothetical protein
LEPENVQVDLIAFGAVVIREALGAFAFDSFVAARRMIARDKIVKIGTL